MRNFDAHVRRHLSRRDVAEDHYDDVVEQLASELEARYAALVHRGSTDEEAWREVLTQVPSWPALARDLSEARNRSRAPADAPHLRVLLAAERWLRDFAHGLRVLRKDRWFTVTATVTLAVCLGGHTAIVAGVSALLFHPLRVPEADRVLLMANQYPLVEQRRGSRSSTFDYDDRLRHVNVFEEQALYNFYGATIESGGLATRMAGMVATPSLFRLLRVVPAHGRIFSETEGTLGNEARVILTDGLWRELFAADPAAIGRTVRLTGREFTIVGVLPPGFSFGDPDARFWVPVALTDRQRSDEARHANGWYSIGRLRPGATIEQARDQLKALDAMNFERTPSRLKSILVTTGFYTGVEPLQDVLVRDVRGPLYLLWAAALAVLAIGVGNLGSLALARSRARLNELGTRLAIGASRFDIVRQLLAEGLLVALGGAAGGLGLGAWLLSAMRSRGLGAGPLHIDGAVAGVTFALAAIAGIVIGLASASPLYTTRLEGMLREGSRSGTRGRTLRATRRALIVAQMACSFMLLTGSALLWVSIRNLLAVDPGFRTENVLAGAISLPAPRYAADDDARTFLNRSLEAIRRLPGVAAAGATTIVPLGRISQTGLIIAEGYVPKPGEPVVSGVRSFVTPGYFEAVGTPLVRGRLFEERDNQPESRAIVIDERLARRFWPDGDAIGRRMFWPANARQISAMDAEPRWLTVIGVVRHARLGGPAADEMPSGTSGTYYLPYAVTAPRDVGYIIRSAGDPIGIVREVRSVLAQIDREIPLFDVRTMSERTELAMMSRTNTMRLAMLFAAVAVFLSAIGLYGMLAHLVMQRTREIGVRLAVGSTPGVIVWLMLREGLVLAIVGVGLGAAGSVAFGRVLASQLHGIAPSNGWVLFLTGLALTAVAVLACVVPARRAAHIDVMRILSAP
jgi:putative ABC transport system permease protein